MAKRIGYLSFELFQEDCCLSNREWTFFIDYFLLVSSGSLAVSELVNTIVIIVLRVKKSISK